MKHKIKQGECLNTLAQKYNFSSWSVIYDAPENEKFRELRPNPNCIFPGDEVFIPEKIGYRKQSKTNTKKTFVITRAKAFISLRLIDRKLAPLSDIPYDIAFYAKDAEESMLELKDQTTNSDGYIEAKIPRNAVIAKVLYQPYPQRPSLKRKMTLKLSELDPVTEESGKRERMKQLGLALDADEKVAETFQLQSDRLKVQYNLSDDSALEDFLENPTAVS